jgi:hypothetical protein
MACENGNGPQTADTSKPTDAAIYIAAMVGALARLAETHDLDALAYILDMAHLEADQIAKQWTISGPPQESADPDPV